MSTERILVKELAESGCRVVLPNAREGHLELWVGRHLRLPGMILVEPGQDGKAVLAADLATLHRLALHPGQILAYSRDDKLLRLGPVVGILTAGPDRAKVPGNRQMFRYVLEACKQAGMIAYVFRPGQINWSSGVAEGYQWRNGRFVLARFPLPDVVYNRVPNRQLEVSRSVLFLKRQLRQRHIPYFNPQYLNKLDLYRMLARRSEAAPYLPWTGRVAGMEDVDRAVKRFGSVYLKPKDAFAGRGILRIGHSRNQYQIRWRINDRNHAVSVSSAAELHARLRQMMVKGTYVVQQAIELARYHGRIFDVRLLAQKNQQGLWQVSGMGVRVGSQGGITTHVPNGGYIAPISQVLPEVFTSRAAEVENRVRTLALCLAPLVEKGCKAGFGEMSMDIGIDRSGRPFFFEANAKPMKFDEDRIRKVGLATLVSYMQYLALGKGVSEDGRIQTN